MYLKCDLPYHIVVVRNKFKILCLLVFFLSAFLLVVVPGSVKAEEEVITAGSCGDESIPYVDAEVTLPAVTYDVYVKLGMRGQQAAVTAYGWQGIEDGNCQTIGSTQATGDIWTRIGSFTPPYQEGGDDGILIQLTSAAFSDEPTANRPAVMLVEQANPVCRPVVECEVSIAGQPGYVRPNGIALGSNSLSVVRVFDPAGDALVKVRYYVDDRLAYELPDLQPFDTRYATYANQKLSRAVEYESGQVIVLPDTISSPDTVEIRDVLFRIYQGYRAWVWFLVVCAGLYIILTVFGPLIHRFGHYIIWRHGHNARLASEGVFGHPHKSTGPLRGWRYERYERRRAMLGYASLALSAIMIAGTLVVLFVSFVGVVYRIDGESMESTIHDGSLRLVNKVPVNMAMLNKSEYVPRRGQVVVMQAIYGVSDHPQRPDDPDTIIKRVIGLPGERIVITNGSIKVYNSEHPEGFNPDKGSPWEKTMHIDEAESRIDLTLNSSEIFVSGDNRPVSADSRFNGAINVRHIIGPVL